MLIGGGVDDRVTSALTGTIPAIHRPATALSNHVVGDSGLCQNQLNVSDTGTRGPRNRFGTLRPIAIDIQWKYSARRCIYYIRFLLFPNLQRRHPLALFNPPSTFLFRSIPDPRHIELILRAI